MGSFMRLLFLVAVVGMVVAANCQPTIKAAPLPVGVSISASGKYLPKPISGGFATGPVKLEAFIYLQGAPENKELQVTLYLDGNPVAGSTRPVTVKSIVEYASFGTLTETGRYMVRVTLYRKGGLKTVTAESQVLRVNIPGEDDAEPDLFDPAR